MNFEPKICFAYITFPDQNTAMNIVRTLVDEQIIACANLLGEIRSIYNWEGKLEDSKEWAAILKLDLRAKAKLKEKIQAVHPYTNPCLVFWEMSDGLPQFLHWISSQTRP